MKFKKCTKIRQNYKGDLIIPRCMNCNQETGICSGMWDFKCTPYNKLELKMLNIYWQCKNQQEIDKKWN